MTGAAGRVGRRVVEALLADGHQVRGFDLQASGNTSSHYVEAIGALQNTQAITAAVEGMDAVLHLGAFMSWAPGERAKMFEDNVEGTRTLLEAAATAKISRFVFASSGEVYPENAPMFLPIVEDHPCHANSPYGLTKLLGEELVKFHQRNGSFETVILRFSHTQDAAELLDEDSFFSGPRFFLQPRIRQQKNFGNHAVAELLEMADPGEPAHILARNEKGRAFKMHITDTRDIVQGLLLALSSPAAAGGTYNLGSTEPVDFPALLAKMSAITGLPVVTVDLPGDGVFYETSNEKIRNELGFEPKWMIGRMLEEAARARRERATG